MSSNDLRRQLEHEIVLGEIVPGTRLDEVALTERFGVSRTPVREALQQLNMMQLVEIRPRRGAFVKKMSLRELVDMFEVMAELEGTCGKLAADRMTDEERDKLKALHLISEPLVADRDYDSYYKANVAFHEAIYKGSHNEFLSEQTKNLRNRLTPYRRLQLRQSNRLNNSFQEHADITDAIINGNKELAEQLLGTHVTVQQGSFNDFLASLPMDLIDQSA
ncbi:GntR family transcriptional regulator [uncultured Kiloniella sp.]|uniref:GntR family transcriptional regulator n=1 Tax=Kiloniella sp. TaxID=1938587 RepID=UPI00260B8305|nr:GntR family transcriptional regulator [uncultured Kiloniella sp.]